MISNNDIKKETINLLKESFFNYYSTPQKETKHLVLDRLFYNERRITSYMTGLQTSLGMGFWEKLAKKLAQLNNFNIIPNSSLVQPEPSNAQLQTLIQQTKAVRESNNGGSLSTFRNTLNSQFLNSYTGATKPLKDGRGCDLILKKNNDIYIFDIKTVQVNSGSGNTFNETIIQWIAYYKYIFGVNANNIHAKIVFPYNSKDENNDATWWTDFGGRVNPLTQDEVDVGNEFWSFLTDNPNALQSIINGVDDIASNQEFIQLFNEVFTYRTDEDLKKFALKVKIKKPEFYRDIKYDGTPEDMTTLGKKYKWKHHNSCIGFQEKVNILLEENDYTCPTCQRVIPYN